jgi:PD-(D/E)XK nuclease superfamily
MHSLYKKADRLSSEIIGAAIEVHRQKGSGLIESIYARYLRRDDPLKIRATPSEHGEMRK